MRSRSWAARSRSTFWMRLTRSFALIWLASNIRSHIAKVQSKRALWTAARTDRGKRSKYCIVRFSTVPPETELPMGAAHLVQVVNRHGLRLGPFGAGAVAGFAALMIESAFASARETGLLALAIGVVDVATADKAGGDVVAVNVGAVSNGNVAPI